MVEYLCWFPIILFSAVSFWCGDTADLILLKNLKIRHLQGISLRNLTTRRTSNRSIGKSMDDEYLPTSIRSPASRVLRQEHGLTHSKSSSELTTSSHFVKVSAQRFIFLPLARIATTLFFSFYVCFNLLVMLCLLNIPGAEVQT